MNNAKEIVDRYIRWAFVPSMRLHRYSTTEDVRFTIRRLFGIPKDTEHVVQQGMVNAGIRISQQSTRYRFYADDSPAAKALHEDRLDWDAMGRSIDTLPHPLLSTRLDPATEFDKLDAAVKAKLLGWIKRFYYPAKRRTRTLGDVAPHYGFPPTNNWPTVESFDRLAHFYGAMLAAGYQPINPLRMVWRFRVGVKSRSAMYKAREGFYS